MEQSETVEKEMSPNASSNSNTGVDEEEKKRVEMLAEINRAKAIFFNNVSYEFYTPLALMLSPLEDMLGESLSSQQRTRIELIQRSGFRLLKLVNALLDFSRIQTDRMQVIYEPIDISQFTIDLVSAFRPIIEKAGLQLIVDTPPLDEVVYVDREMYEKIIFNLLSNAFKFTLTGNIRISLKKQNGHVELSVQDTGVGIPKSDLSRVFECFYRVEYAQSRGYEGARIGLALVKEFVKLHGGYIEVESQQGHGSCFTVVIPLGASHLPANKLGVKRETYQPGHLGSLYVEEAAHWLSEDVALPATEFKASQSLTPELALTSTEAHGLPILKRRILLVDSDADMRQYLKSLLEKQWQIEAVGDGEAALQLALRHPPHLVLSEVIMPKLDGVSLVKALRQNPCTQIIPIVLLSTRADEEAKIKGMKAGADDYLVKPFSTRELLVRIESHLKIAHLRKIAAQREQELLRATQSAQENLAQVLTNLNDGFEMFNRDWQFTYVNQQLTALACKSKDELLGKVVWDVFPDIKGTSLEHDFRMAMETGKTVTSEFYYPALKCWFEYRIYPNAEGVSVLVSDITLHKQLETERQQAMALVNQQQQWLLEEADCYRHKQAEFIDTLCHELRNPLNGICGSVSLLHDDLSVLRAHFMNQPSLFDKRRQESIGNVFKQIDENVNAIEQCSQQQKVIVNDVLDFSKLEDNKVELNTLSFNLKQQVDNIIQMFHAPLQQKNLQLIIDVPDDLWLKADPCRLSQILINLISNAIKFTQVGSIHLKASIDVQINQMALLCVNVEDTGMGMTENEISNLFQRFSQANRRTASEYGGSGLGLLISKKLVEIMGGIITVKSKKNQGTCFTVTMRVLTLTEDEKQQAQREQDQLKLKSSQLLKLKKTILIVEDNIVNQKILINYLKKLKGCLYHIAENGLEALKKYQKFHVDFIFMDIEMPKMNGLEATRRIRALEKGLKYHVPIVGLSGNARKERMEAAMQAGMDAYLTKPYQKQEIYEVIEKYLQPIHEIESQEISQGTDVSLLPSVISRIAQFKSDARILLQQHYPFIVRQDQHQWCIQLEEEKAQLTPFLVTLVLNQLKAYLEKNVGDLLTSSMTVNQNTLQFMTATDEQQSAIQQFIDAIGFTSRTAFSSSIPSVSEHMTFFSLTTSGVSQRTSVSLSASVTLRKQKSAP